MKRPLKRIVEETGTFTGRTFDLTIQALIVVSLVSFSIETLPGLSTSTRDVLYTIEIFTVLVFTLEYLLRIAVADQRLAFVLSVGGMIDLLAIAPFYLPLAVDLRGVRVFRLFRIVRLFKLVRYTRAIDRFRRAFVEIRDELTVFFVATLFVMFIASVGMYYFEGEHQPKQFGSVFHCMWWAVVTMTTVGYGDAYPVTAAGRVFTAVILFAGLGVVAIPSGLLASALSHQRSEAASKGLAADTTEDVSV